MGTLTLPLLAALTLGYLLGSIPFGLLLTKAAGLGDIRNVGSGNIGATNVLRTGNKGLAAATLILDALKGTAAILLAKWLALDIWLWVHSGGVLPPVSMNSTLVSDIRYIPAAAGLGAFLGHLYPVWLGFKGGKGVATYIGVLFGLALPVGIAFCAIWLLVAVSTKYSSLSALIASIATPFVVWALGEPQLALMLVPLTLLLFHKHSANISRLLKGEEPKIGAKA
jgi:glycerol-3-phosphate acyltransferase PlsY